MTDQKLPEPAQRARDAAPYCFQAGDTTVRVSFQAEGETLEQKLTSYFLRLKT